VKRVVITFLVGLAFTITTVGCNEDEGRVDPAPTGEPIEETSVGVAPPLASSATVVPANGPCPISDDVCALVARIDVGLQNGDLSPLLSVVTEEEFVCDQDTNPRVGSLTSLCADAEDGERRYGLGLGRLPGTVSARSLSTFTRTVQRWLDESSDTQDEMGGAALRVYSIGCPTIEAELIQCRDNFSIVLSAIVIEQSTNIPARVFAVIPVTWLDDPSSSFVYIAGTYTQEYEVLLRGGAAGNLAYLTQEPEFFSGRPAPETGNFVAWSTF